MIETGGFCPVTFEIGNLGGQTLYQSTPWPKWDPIASIWSRQENYRNFWVPPRKFDFFQSTKIIKHDTARRKFHEVFSRVF